MAYDFMHPPDVQLADGPYEDNSQAYADGPYHFRQHQVVNHSHGFADPDMVKGNYTKGYIHTNIIEGWNSSRSHQNPRSIR